MAMTKEEHKQKFGDHQIKTCNCADEECEHRKHRNNDDIGLAHEFASIDNSKHQPESTKVKNDNNLKEKLEINTSLVNKYSVLANRNIDTIPQEYKLMFELAIMALDSMQCNEPFEKLLTELLGLTLNIEKHGWDGWDGNSVETSANIYEMKPTISNPPTVSINDDSIEKIRKNICNNDQKGWLVIASINRNTYSFSKIYKFPIEIYKEDRIKYLNSIMEKNSTQTKQTRVVYSITVSKSIKLCKEYNKKYYVWNCDE